MVVVYRHDEDADRVAVITMATHEPVGSGPGH
jgi:hypothetical protein